MSGLAERNGGRGGLVLLAVILALGLGLRVGEAWDGRAPVFDAAAYATIAANLDRGEGFTLGRDATQPASNYSPGLPLLVAGVYEVIGGIHERLARVLLALVGSLAVRRPSAGLFDATVDAYTAVRDDYQQDVVNQVIVFTDDQSGDSADSSSDSAASGTRGVVGTGRNRAA